MRQKFGAAFAALIILASLFGLVSNAGAEQTPPPGEVCIDRVQQTSWTRSIPQFKTQHEVDKFVRERSRTDRQHYSWTGGKRDVDDPPTVVPPHRDWQANTRQEPHSTGGGNPATWVNESLHYTANSKGHASWFYFVGYGDWTEWSTPTRWEPIGSHLEWVDEVPAANWQHHASNSTYERQWTVYPTGATRQEAIDPIVENSGWIDGTEPPAQGDGPAWQKVGERTRNGEEIPCDDEPTPPNCDTSAVTGSVKNWLANNDLNGSECFDIDITQACGGLDGSVTTQPQPQYGSPFRLVWVEGEVDSGTAPSGYQNFPAVFDEDHNGGSTTVSYFIVGPEKDWLLGFANPETPNYWEIANGTGEALTVEVNTDCLVELEIPTPTVTRLCDESAIVSVPSVPGLSWTAPGIAPGVASPFAVVDGLESLTFTWTADDGSRIVGPNTYTLEIPANEPCPDEETPPTTTPPTTTPEEPETPPTTQPTPPTTPTPPAPQATPPASLPRTGNEALSLALKALGLLGLGGTALVIGRRRQTA